MINRLLNHQLLLWGVFLMLTNSCKKEDESTPPILFNADLTYGTMTDQDGNTYKTITIGTQTWMAENLKTTKYRNGDPIPDVSASGDWGALITGAYCYYNNDANNSKTYGRLYNWYAANDTRNIAPTGWHVPSYNEWATLIDFLGEEDTAGIKLMETGTSHWTETPGGTNESGFTALPAGCRTTGSVGNNFCNLGTNAYYWTTDDDNTYNAWNLSISSTYYGKIFYLHDKTFGFSVRCIED